MMKKIITVFIILLSWQLAGAENYLPVTGVNAHAHNDDMHDIGIGAGPCSLFGYFVYGAVGVSGTVLGGIFSQSVNFDFCGNYALHYYAQVKPWCQVGGKITVEGCKLTRYADSAHTVVTDKSQLWTLAVMPGVHFTYLNRPMVRLYSGLDLGAAFLLSQNVTNVSDSVGNDIKPVFMAFNITPIGVQVGKTFYGMFEINVGYDAVLKLGVGYRF